MKYNLVATAQHGLLTALLALFFISPAHSQQSAPVEVDLVVTEPLSQTQPVLGRFVARQSGTVASRVAGAVTDILVDVGDRVTKGQVLAVVDLQKMTLLRDAAAATANHAIAEEQAAIARLTRRQNELSRIEGITESAAYSVARHEDAIQNEAEAEAFRAAAAAKVATTQALLMLAEDDRFNSKIRAPYDGLIAARHTEIGSYLQAGSGVVDLVNDRNIEIEVYVPSNRVAGLNPGTVIQVRPVGGSEFSAVVRGIGAEENATSRTRLVRFTPQLEEEASFGVGEAVDALLPLGVPRQIITVHKDAILKMQGLTMAYVVAEDNTAQIRSIELGDATAARFEVLSGLSPGEPVVIRGNERLRPGQSVRIGIEETNSEEAGGNE